MSTCGARSVSVHALQALTLMNSDFMFQQSQALAQRLFTETRGNQKSMIDRLFLLALGRKPQPAEIQATNSFLIDQAKIVRRRIGRGEAVVRLKGLPDSIDRVMAAAWVDLCLATMNLNEFVYVK
jgi:Protein of unknown function (DUF1553)